MNSKTARALPVVYQAAVAGSQSHWEQHACAAPDRLLVLLTCLAGLWLPHVSDQVHPQPTQSLRFLAPEVLQSCLWAGQRVLQADWGSPLSCQRLRLSAVGRRWRERPWLGPCPRADSSHSHLLAEVLKLEPGQGMPDDGVNPLHSTRPWIAHSVLGYCCARCIDSWHQWGQQSGFCSTTASS